MPQLGLERYGVLALPDEAAKFPYEDDLEGGDMAAFGLVQVLAGHGVAVGLRVVLERPQLGGHAAQRPTSPNSAASKASKFLESLSAPLFQDAAACME